jgi:four helix bundle protein
MGQRAEGRAKCGKGRAQRAERKAQSAKGMGQRAERRGQSAERRAQSEIAGDAWRMAKFRFEDLDIWKVAIEIGDELFDISERLDKKRLYRFAEQLRGAGMSMSNNIAEGSGSSSVNEFHQFLNIARRSTFENANILILLRRRKLIEEETLENLLDKLDHLCRMITNFQKSLK